jgi:hypothetical protein
VVLLPAAALAGLSPRQIEALLAHELAHVRRHDYLVNLLQSAAETLLFYHPAVWWVSRQVRKEREDCCDDLALTVCADRALYAATLTDVAAMAVTPSIALAATDGSLVHRVGRILGQVDPRRRTPSAAVTALFALLITGAVVPMMAMRSPEPPQTDPTPAVTTEPARISGPQDGIPSGVTIGEPEDVTAGVRSGVPRGIDDAVQTNSGAGADAQSEDKERELAALKKAYEQLYRQKMEQQQAREELSRADQERIAQDLELAQKKLAEQLRARGEEVAEGQTRMTDEVKALEQEMLALKVRALADGREDGLQKKLEEEAVRSRMFEQMTTDFELKRQALEASRVPSTYELKAGDVVSVEVRAESGRLVMSDRTIGDNGMVKLMFVGDVKLGGLTVEKAEKTLHGRFMSNAVRLDNANIEKVIVTVRSAR